MTKIKYFHKRGHLYYNLVMRSILYLGIFGVFILSVNQINKIFSTFAPKKPVQKVQAPSVGAQSTAPSGYESEYDRKTREFFERAKRENIKMEEFKNNPNFKEVDQIKVEDESFFKKSLELAYKNEEDDQKKKKGKNKNAKDKDDEFHQAVLKFAKNKEVSTSFVGDDILSGDDFSIYLLSGKSLFFKRKFGLT